MRHKQFLGIHTWSHPHLGSTSHEKLVLEIDKTMQVFQEQTGERPWFFRAPYGELNQDAKECLMERRLYTFHWDLDSRDWQLPHDNIKETIRRNLRKGIILLHEHTWTTNQMSDIIATIRSEGYRFASPAKLFANNTRFAQEACPSRVHAAACNVRAKSRTPADARAFPVRESLWVPNCVLLVASLIYFLSCRLGLVKSAVRGRRV